MKISIDDVRYYFDAKEKDSLDVGPRVHRNREVLSIRDRLLALPDRDFEVTIKAFKKMLTDESKQVSGQENRSQDAQMLYESTNQKA